MDNEHLGHLELKEAQIPTGLKDTKVGAKTTMTITVEKTGINKREDWGAPMEAYKPGVKPKARPKVMMHSFKITGVEGKSNPL